MSGPQPPIYHGPWPSYSSSQATEPTLYDTYHPAQPNVNTWPAWPTTPPPILPMERSSTLVKARSFDHSSPSIGEERLPQTPRPDQLVFQQPQPRQSMISTRRTGGNRNVKNLPYGPDGRSWSYGLCDCCGDWAICCLAWGWSSCTFGTIKKRYDHLDLGGSPDPEHGNRGFCGGRCCLHCSLSIIAFQWIPQMMQRSKIRARYDIAGNCCSDCCTSFWCGPCDLTQQSREVLLEEDSFIVR